jgi:hypothetical protein
MLVSWKITFYQEALTLLWSESPTSFFLIQMTNVLPPRFPTEKNWTLFLLSLWGVCEAFVAPGNEGTRDSMR